MKKCPLLSGLSVFAAALLLGGCDEKTRTYQADIKPILTTHCVSCHVPGTAGHDRSGLRLDSYDAILKGTRFGAIVQPGSSVSSILYRLVSGQLDPSIRMPHGQARLSDAEVSMIGTWIDQGAQY